MNQQPDQQSQNQSIIKRIKTPTKKQKIIRIAIIIILIILLAIGIGFLIKYKLNKTDQNKLQPAYEESKKIKNQIKAIDEQNKNKPLSVFDHSNITQQKIALYEKKLKQYQNNNRTSDYLDLLIDYIDYLITIDSPSFALSFVEKYSTHPLSLPQKKRFYESAKKLYKKAGKGYEPKVEHYEKLLNNKE